jgi:hypothetical protein
LIAKKKLSELSDSKNVEEESFIISCDNFAEFRQIQESRFFGEAQEKAFFPRRDFRRPGLPGGIAIPIWVYCTKIYLAILLLTQGSVSCWHTWV